MQERSMKGLARMIRFSNPVNLAGWLVGFMVAALANTAAADEGCGCSAVRRSSGSRRIMPPP